MKSKYVVLLVYSAVAASTIFGSASCSFEIESNNESNLAADPSSFTKKNLDNGWIQYEKNSDADISGFALSFPADWDVVGLDEGMIEHLTEKMAAEPAVDSLLNNQPASKDYFSETMKLFAVDSKTGAGNTVNAHIDWMPIPEGVTFDSFLQSAMTTMPPPLKFSRIDHPAGEAALLIYRISGEAATVESTGYFFFKEDQGCYLLVMTANEKDAAGYAELFDQIGKGFRWK